MRTRSLLTVLATVVVAGPAAATAGAAHPGAVTARPGAAVALAATAAPAVEGVTSGAAASVPATPATAAPMPATAPAGTTAAAPGTGAPPRHLPAPPPARIDGYLPVETDPLLGTATTLRYHVEMPDPKVWGNGPYPTVMDYSGYAPGTEFFDGLGTVFKNQGYAVIGVNIRGTGCSGGKFDYFEPVQSVDGYDAVEFAAAQYWSNGDVAMVGKSYPGITQMFVAAKRPPHLRAIVPGSYFGDLYRDVPFPGGIENVAFAALWSMTQPFNGGSDQQTQGIEAGDQTCIANQAAHAANPPFNPFVQSLEVMNQFDSDFFHTRSPNYFANQIDVPVLAVESWQDEEVGSRGIDLIDHLHPGLPYRVVVQNGDHGEYYNPSTLPEIYRFLDYHLRKQVPAQDVVTVRDDHHVRPITYREALERYQDEPRVLVNWEDGVNGDTASWQTRFASWPPPRTVVDRLYLHSGGTLSGAQPAALDPTTSYTYAEPLGTQGRGWDTVGSRGVGPVNTPPFPGPQWQNRPPAGTFAEFTTAPFATDQELLGSASLDLWLSSTAADTDLEVTVVEVHPDGSEVYVQKGWLRASHRALDPTLSTPLRPYQTHQLADLQPLVPGQATPMRVEIFPFGQVFRAGTALRIYVEAPNILPDEWGFLPIPVVAQNSIYTDAAHPSSLALPLIPHATAPVPERPCGQLRNQPCR